MTIGELATIVLALWAAMLTLLALGENFYIQLYADGYSPAVFTITELKFHAATTGSSGIRPTSTPARYWAFGEIDGKRERFGLKGFTEATIQSQYDLEKEFSIGQELQVLYNPDIPRKLDVHIQYPFKDFKRTHQHRRMQMVKAAYGPWAMAFCLFCLFGVLTKRVGSVAIVSLSSLFFIGMSWLLIYFNLSNVSDEISTMLNHLFR